MEGEGASGCGGKGGLATARGGDGTFAGGSLTAYAGGEKDGANGRDMLDHGSER